LVVPKREDRRLRPKEQVHLKRRNERQIQMGRHEWARKKGKKRKLENAKKDARRKKEWIERRFPFTGEITEKTWTWCWEGVHPRLGEKNAATP